MPDFSKLVNRATKANKNTVSSTSSNKSYKRKIIQIDGKYYEHLRYDVFRHEGTKMTDWANKALKYAIDNKII